MKRFHISKLSWNDSLLTLTKKKPSQTILNLIESGFESLRDLLWIIPLRVVKKPKLASFGSITLEKVFLGEGKVLNLKSSPAFGRRGKGRIQLFNISLIVKDSQSNALTTLQFFNTYPNIRKQLSELENIAFMGTPSLFKGSIHFVNPTINPKEQSSGDDYLIDYPTVATISGTLIKKAIDLIPTELWGCEIECPEKDLILPSPRPPLHILFKVIHGKKSFMPEEYDESLEHLKYYEFLEEQFKVIARKKSYESLQTKKIEWKDTIEQNIRKKFPYDLTDDQDKVLKEIKEDFSKETPMMRILQGDVGCGKTTIAIITAMQAIANNGQVAIMCPTEALARQHHETFKEFFKDPLCLEILLGSTHAKSKSAIYTRLQEGRINLIIGTHSLFQEKVFFKNLRFVIIDEQHKFGVNQRLKLTQKGHNPHSLIMSATPIPRTLQLARYGDLNISTIKTMPRNRIPIKTRLVTNKTFMQYLTFIKTRISLGEQVYVVTPAIEESEILDIENVTQVYSEFIQYFPDLSIGVLHGKLKSQEKEKILQDFLEKKINILITTSVIEVGINILNASVMSIFNPDRFGLSSLHQLRGRVGRSNKASFCFLVTKKQLPKESLERLRIIEENTDGFIIAEADLKNRGQGDLFGTDQSGSRDSRKVANLLNDFDLFNQVINDIPEILATNKDICLKIIEHYNKDKKVSSTI